jgi:hypothetical protein
LNMSENIPSGHQTWLAGKSLIQFFLLPSQLNLHLLRGFSSLPCLMTPEDISH